MVEQARPPASGDGWRPPSPVPIKPPEEVDGFRFAAVANGYDDQERARPWPDRPWVTDAEERGRLLGYLRAGALLLPSDERTYDVFDPTNPAKRWAVPVRYRTDGTWIWCEISTYQLQENHLAPQPAFYEHMEGQGYRCPPVDEPARLAAREALFERGRIEKRLRAEYRKKQYLETTPPSLVRGELSNEPPTIAMDEDRFHEIDPDTQRFHLDVETTLFDAGWLPGRDAAGRVDPWLADFSAQTDSSGRSHEIFPAARDIYREFGLLDLYPFGRGEETGAFPIHFFPADVPLSHVSAFGLAARLGMRTFPIGRTDDSTNVLIVDEKGRVYMDHDIAGELFLGPTIDAALEVLVRGLHAPTLQSHMNNLR
ncbi:Uncharacterised protein [Mycobacterium tuberculosis]|nr:Uncharacterised protein [Mycobacterium tuberculosis]